jgi:undecaprenyl-diphosphatase
MRKIFFAIVRGLRGNSQLVRLIVTLGLGVLMFSILAHAVAVGKTRALDEAILRALRKSDSGEPIGPRWVRNGMRDATALGSTAVLSLASAAVFGFLLLQKNYRQSLTLAVVVSSAFLLNRGLKIYFDRPRPGVVSHLDFVDSRSFPSGHTLLATIIYLTLAALLVKTVNDPRLRKYIFAVCFGLVALVGVTRVYLGVHYPTDVLAGWLMGGLWAFFCGRAAQTFSEGGRAT